MTTPIDSTHPSTTAGAINASAPPGTSTTAHTHPSAGPIAGSGRVDDTPHHAHGHGHEKSSHGGILHKMKDALTGHKHDHHDGDHHAENTTTTAGEPHPHRTGPSTVGTRRDDPGAREEITKDPLTDGMLGGVSTVTMGGTGGGLV